MINFNSFYFSIIHVFGVESFQANDMFLKVHMFLTFTQIEY